MPSVPGWPFYTWQTGPPIGQDAPCLCKRALLYMAGKGGIGEWGSGGPVRRCHGTHLESLSVRQSFNEGASVEGQFVTYCHLPLASSSSASVSNRPDVLLFDVPAHETER